MILLRDTLSSSMMVMLARGAGSSLLLTTVSIPGAAPF